MLGSTMIYAHTGEPIEPHDLLTAWRFEPGIMIPLLLSALLYMRGARAGCCTTRWTSVCFWSGWSALVLALISPLHPLGEALFSAHMVQHEMLMLVVAPLLVLSRPVPVFLWGVPLSWRRSLGRWSKFPPVRQLWQSATAPISAWLIHAAALWLWHAPQLFQATLRNDLVHTAQHISFLGSALLFWWSLFETRGAAIYGIAVLSLFTTAVHTSILGALLTFSPSVWYPAYAFSAPIWGMSALEDQQLGGLIMWVPGGLVYVIAALILFARWLQESSITHESRYAN